MANNTWWVSSQQLDDAQKNIIQIPTDEGNYLVVGPPGSGKTNVLLLRAAYLRSAGIANCVVLVFTRSLREFIATGASDSTRLPPNRIQTHAAWTLDLLRKLGRPFRPSSDDLTHDELRQGRHDALSAAAHELHLGAQYYDSLLLDEVQDYWTCEVELLSVLTRRLFVVGDARQRIYDRNEGIQAALAAGCSEKTLKYHYRIGPAICDVADRLLPLKDGPPLSQNCQYDDREFPSRVDVHTIPFHAQLENLRDRLVQQLVAYPDQTIGVIATRRSTRDEIAKFLRSTELANGMFVQSEDDNDLAFDADRPIVVSTLHSAKGTEHRCVHFLATDDFPYYTREKAFTLVTRAKTRLDVYHASTIEPSLESALAKRTPPNLEEAFR